MTAGDAECERQAAPLPRKGLALGPRARNSGLRSFALRSRGASIGCSRPFRLTRSHVHYWLYEQALVCPKSCYKTATDRYSLPPSLQSKFQEEIVRKLTFAGGAAALISCCRCLCRAGWILPWPRAVILLQSKLVRSRRHPIWHNVTDVGGRPRKRDVTGDDRGLAGCYSYNARAGNRCSKT